MNTDRAKKLLYVSIALIPAGAVIGFLHGGLGLALMVLGWLGVLFYDGPAHGQLRYGRSLVPDASAPPAGAPKS
jgi:hypothetical protein